MIKNTAVVNEENTSAQYWKDRYYKEVALHKSQSLPVDSKHAPHSLCRKCEGRDPNSLILNANEVKEMYQQIKVLTLALKEER